MQGCSRAVGVPAAASVTKCTSPGKPYTAGHKMVQYHYTISTLHSVLNNKYQYTSKLSRYYLTLHSMRDTISTSFKYFLTQIEVKIKANINKWIGESVNC